MDLQDRWRVMDEIQWLIDTLTQRERARLRGLGIGEEQRLVEARIAGMVEVWYGISALRGREVREWRAQQKKDDEQCAR